MSTSAAPPVYGPPKPSAVAQIARLNARAPRKVILRAKPRINARAMMVSVMATP